MLGRILIWLLKGYYLIGELWNSMCKVLKIKYKRPKSNLKLKTEEDKGHLAVRLSDTKVAGSEELLELIGYVHKVFHVKYLTIICGGKGFEKELDLRRGSIEDISFSIYHNFEVVSPVRSNAIAISVNLIDFDSENLFLSKLKDLNNSSSDTATEIYQSALKLFTGTGIIVSILILFCFFSLSTN